MVLWGVFLNKWIINDIFVGLLFPVYLFTFMVLMNFAKNHLNDDTTAANSYRKCMPILFFLNAVYTFVGWLTAILDFVGDPSQRGASIAIIVFSSIFMSIWVQAMVLS